MRENEDVPRVKTLLIGHYDVSQLLPMDECINVMEEAFKALALGDAIRPQRQIIWLPNKKGAPATVPSYLNRSRVIGAKIVTVFPENQNTPYDAHQGTVLLFECDYGRPIVALDASSIAAIRTAAVSGAATKVLAREDAR
jgi:ornithine cyclodeaminase/alanine dehydrogenase-like protein (mu-crystallin family)